MTVGVHWLVHTLHWLQSASRRTLSRSVDLTAVTLWRHLGAKAYKSRQGRRLASADPSAGFACHDGPEDTKQPLSNLGANYRGGPNLSLIIFANPSNHPELQYKASWSVKQTNTIPLKACKLMGQRLVSIVSCGTRCVGATWYLCAHEIEGGGPGRKGWHSEP